ncbi:hypothetical protein [Sphingomonas sp. ID0503]|uniref:hypothetical protein n=1 Tax=Sphingomonas sp. ID0503 TaxID=3399691 RepID=UPI003AFB6E6D
MRQRLKDMQCPEVEVVELLGGRVSLDYAAEDHHAILAALEARNGTIVDDGFGCLQILTNGQSFTCEDEGSGSYAIVSTSARSAMLLRSLAADLRGLEERLAA